jgi:molybdate/tungstate transport system ATP-binding protein
VAKMAGLKNYFKAIIKPSSNGFQTALVNNVALRFNGNCSQETATLLIDESQISLSLLLTESSAQNCLAGQVIDFHKLPLGVEVTLDAGIFLVSRITEESFQRLDIKPGKTIWASFKASAVRLIY